MPGFLSDTDAAAAAVLTKTPTLPGDRRKAALVLCDRIGLNLAPDQWLDPDIDPKAVADRDEILDLAAFLLGAIDVVGYAHAATPWTPAAPLVAHGTKSAVAYHAATRVPRCGPCDRWIDVHNRATTTITPVRHHCGTSRGCQAHHRAGEQLCVICQLWSDERHAASRLQPGARCGTATGAQMHRNLGERICDACRNAENEDRRHATSGSRTGRPSNVLTGKA